MEACVAAWSMYVLIPFQCVISEDFRKRSVKLSFVVVITPAVLSSPASQSACTIPRTHADIGDSSLYHNQIKP